MPAFRPERSHTHRTICGYCKWFCGHLNKCKACTKKDVKNRYYSPEGFEKIRQYERSRFQTSHRKTKALEYQRNRRQRRPGKNLARAKVINAIRNGRLIRLPCAVCGNSKSEGHHIDYRKPLDIRWLCFTHHRKIHGQLQAV
jgi:hypothetical protein